MAQFKKVSATVYTTVTFSSNHEFRYVLEKLWDKKKPVALVISLSAGKATQNFYDYTTLYICNALNKEFGKVYIMNVFAHIQEKYKTDEENIRQIKEYASKDEVSKIILCWGRGCDTASASVKKEIMKVERIVKEIAEDKCFVIEDNRGVKGIHPLKAQNTWNLVKWKINDKKEMCIDNE